MKIEPTMNLDHLADLMYITGSEPVDAEVVAMRDMLLQGQESHEWKTTSDVEDAEWFSMLDQAVSSAAIAKATGA